MRESGSRGLAGSIRSRCTYEPTARKSESYGYRWMFAVYARHVVSRERGEHHGERRQQFDEPATASRER